jgi:hypothetical protein
MPLYHVSLELEVGGSVMQIQQVVECATSDPGSLKIDINRLVEKGKAALQDSRQYFGEVKKLDLVLGNVPKPVDPEPLTDRRGAIRDQKARNG